MLKSEKNKIELNEQFRKALDLLEHSDKHLFITGRAGTGKSTLLAYARSITKKKMAILAPTGVAAVNINGQTIHSFFGFKPDITLAKVNRVSGNRRDLYKNLDTIIIDEISMVRADLLDCVDKFLRLNGKNKNASFGGIQMIFIGDLYQLPPVITGKEKNIFTEQYKSGYFFSAFAFQGFDMEFIELEKIYRQKDEKFINLLNSIRNNSATPNDLALLNKRFDPYFKPDADDFYVYLTTTNDLSRQINDEHLKKIKGDACYFAGQIRGEFDSKYLPTDVSLSVKIGAQVMLLNNDSQGRWINGSIGKIIDIDDNKNGGADIIAVELESGATVEVLPYEWTIYSYAYNPRLNILETETVGSFSQYPLKLAWSLTIHKSQGKTFPRVIIDIGRGTFAHGQMYVALSRCISLEGLVLKKEIKKQHIFIDWRVADFVTKYQYKISDQKMPLEQKVEMIRKAIKNQSKLEIIYLKARDEKSQRVIEPGFIGEMEYANKKFLGLKAIDNKKGDRIFRVDRILEMKETE